MLDSDPYVERNVKKSGASPPLLHAGVSLIWTPPARSHGGSLGAGGIFFPHILPIAVNVVSLGEYSGSLVAYRPPWSAVAGGVGPGCMPGRLLPAGTSVVWTDPNAEHGGSGATSQWHSPI